ncbi:hypothetical protein [Variovorax ginsengisoli]|uniref:DUF3618 domain-containing protein n=1 Tax=Variovorax ginsengisoli TaxID=363844 RepID=A0ABT8S3I8_9BURK|nr:hypothetical protein [Variovorax ginsengisoli]MDN8612751.1 hypothetical protein [Variovorax ginsengisoli]MDO1531921.1 hypothetical protein [Variovorax ginsengisoli]
MTRSQFAELRTRQIGAAMGALAPRTSRDVCRDACAIERPAPKAGGHRWIVPACIAAVVALFFILKGTS